MQIFRLFTTYMKMNLILYVNFQATDQFFFKFYITLQCHDTNFLAEAYACDKNSPSIFQTFECCNESSPNSSCHFWKYLRSGFIQILDHCSVSWKIIHLYFFSSNLIYLGQKEPIEVKLSDFWVVGWKFTKPQVSLSLNFASLFSVMRDNPFVLFSRNLYDLDKRSLSKCEISIFQLLIWNFTKFVLL